MSIFDVSDISPHAWRAMARKLQGRSFPTAQINLFVRSVDAAPVGTSASKSACELAGIHADGQKQDGRDSSGINGCIDPVSSSLGWEDREGTAALLPHHCRVHAALPCFSPAHRSSTDGLLVDSSASDSSPEPTHHPPATTAMGAPQGASAAASEDSPVWSRNAYPDWSGEQAPEEEEAVSSVPQRSSWKRGVRHLLPGRRAV